jgi:hypothetical protein
MLKWKTRMMLRIRKKSTDKLNTLIKRLDVDIE